MRRWFYFFLERLNITPGERRLVITAIILFLAVTLFDYFTRPGDPFNSAYYSPLEKEFRKDIVLARKRDSLQKAKFYTIHKITSNKERKRAFHQNRTRDINTGKSSKKRKKELLKKASVAINSADVKTLMLLPGIGPKTAEKIIVYRKKNGLFSSFSDIMKVKGIGKKKLKKIKPYLRLNPP